MPVQVTCNHCRKQIKIPDHLTGVSVKCPNCKAPLPLASPPDDPYLADLLQAAAASTAVPASPRPQGASPFASSPRRKAQSTPARKQGGSASFVKHNAWAVASLLSALPFLVIADTPVLLLVLVPWLLGCVIVFFSERGRKNKDSESGLSSVDRVLFGAVVGLGLLTTALGALAVAVAAAKANGNAGVAIGAALLYALIGVAVNAPGWLLLYGLARLFGLGRTLGACYVFCGLAMIALILAVPGEALRHPMAAAQKAGEDARRAGAAQNGGNPNVAIPGAGNGNAAPIPGLPFPVMNGRLETAGVNGNHESRILRETNIGDIKITVATIGMVGSPSPPTEVHIFHPTSMALAGGDGKRPCVMIAPAGSNLLTGKSAVAEDYGECLPWARAGFYVVLYSLDGSPDGLGHAPNDDELKECFMQFKRAHAGLFDFELAKLYVMTSLDKVDHFKFVTVGHSSASVLALLAAETDLQVKACVAFGTIPDTQAVLGPSAPQLEAALPGISDFARHFSPQNHIDQIHSSIFLFHADDDQIAPVDRVRQFAESAQRARKHVDFVRVPTGGHRDAMVREGIPQAIAWASKLLGEGPGAVPNALAGAPQAPGMDRPADPPSARRRLGDGLMAHQAEKNLRELDFTDRLKHAFAWDKAKTRDLLAARLITSDDNDQVLHALGRAPALERPSMNVYFMLGITGLDRPARNGAKWMEQKGAEGEYRQAAGDPGMMLLDGLMTRVERGTFGDWGCDVQPPQESDPRAVLFATADSEDFLRTFADQQNVDVLITLNMTSKLAGTKKKRGRVVTLVMRVIDVASNTDLWTSKPLTSTAIASGRAKGQDPSVQIVNDLLEYCDQNLKLEPLSEMTAADAKAEADKLIEVKSGSALQKLAALRVFQCQGLLTPEQTAEYADRILDREGAQSFVSDEPLDRLDAIEALVPKR